MTDEALFYTMLAAGSFVMFLFFVVGLICYILLAAGLYTMANNKGIENPWFAWIPILQLYTLGQIIEEIRFGDFEVPNVPLALVAAALAPIVLGWIPLLGWLITLASAVLGIYSLYLLFEMYSENAVVKTILSVVIPFLGPIFVFMLRNESPKSAVDPFDA